MNHKAIIKAFRLPIVAIAVLCASTNTLAQPGPGGPPQTDKTIDAGQRQAVIDSLIKELNERYVFPEQAKKIELSLRQQQKQGAFNAITSATHLAQTLTEQLQKEAHDKHLMVRYSERLVPERVKDGKPSPEELAEELSDMKARNFGVDSAERMPFNIGYLNLRGFDRAKDAAPTIAAAMTVLTNTRALIIDLRRNNGGDMATVAMLASYFLNDRTHLSDAYHREGDRTDQIWSTDYVLGAKYGEDKPLYILTSKRTFSAGEDLSYTLQKLKRATIVGETTGGGANPGEVVRLHPHFGAFVPMGRSINSITKTNWEGTGVTPDVNVPAADALKVAQLAILKQLIAKTQDTRQAQAYQGRVNELEAGPAALPASR